MSQDIGPVYHPEDADYIKRWHEARGDIETTEGSGIWRDSETRLVIDPKDYPLPTDYELGLELAQDENGKWYTVHPFD